MKKNRISLSLDDLRVESFETLPELGAAEAARVEGGEQGCHEFTCQFTCYLICATGAETNVCCYPTRGNASAVGTPGPGPKDPR